jgi:hypothetical protein
MAKIKAKASFTAFTDQMNVFNIGDSGELPDDMAAQYVDAGLAEYVGKRPVKEEPADEQAPA